MNIFETNLENSGQYHKVVLLSEVRKMLKKFCDHYPFGTNPDLDAAYVEANDMLAEDNIVFIPEWGPNRKLHDALSGIMDLIETGQLVRSISHDSESGWAMKQIKLVQILAAADEALTKERR